MNVWFAVNKNGFIGLYTDKPIRNEETGKWESKHPFINSILYPQIVDLVEKTKFTWQNDPEILQLNI